ncbi:UNVERIFIED_CONTAM: hypothetical protein K2H54_065938 [Gekko kuhli]
MHETQENLAVACPLSKCLLSEKLLDHMAVAVETSDFNDALCTALVCGQLSYYRNACFSGRILMLRA